MATKDDGKTERHYYLVVDTSCQLCHKLIDELNGRNRPGVIIDRKILVELFDKGSDEQAQMLQLLKRIYDLWRTKGEEFVAKLFSNTKVTGYKDTSRIKKSTSAVPYALVIDMDDNVLFECLGRPDEESLKKFYGQNDD